MSKKDKPKHAKLIVNPGSGTASGRGKLLEQAARCLKKQGIDVDVAVAKPKERAIPIVRQAIKDGYKTIIAMGGDDTIEAIIRGMAGSKVRLGMIPVGTANNLAKGLGIPEDVEQACAIIAAGKFRKLDLGLARVGKRKKLPFFELVTVGIAAAIYPEALRVRKGRLDRLKTAIQKAWHHEIRPKITLQMDGESEVTVESMQVIVSNVPLIGLNMLVTPHASTDDGLLDVALFPNFTKAELLAYSTRVMNQGTTDDGKIQRYRASSMTIRSAPKQAVMADGVMLGKGKVKIKVWPGALRVYTPPVGSGVEKPQDQAEVDLPAPVAPAVDKKNAKSNGEPHQGKPVDEQLVEIIRTGN